MLDLVPVRDWNPFPVPVAPDPDDPSYRDRDGSAAQFTSVKRFHGRCAPFCAYEDGPNQDESVEDHGDVCSSWPHLAVSGTTRTPWDGTVHAVLSVPYLHGVYSSWDGAAVERRGYVQLSVDDGTANQVDLYLSAEKARTVAAGLCRLADELENSGRDDDR